MAALGRGVLGLLVYAAIFMALSGVGWVVDHYVGTTGGDPAFQDEIDRNCPTYTPTTYC
jgi:hypothetical protein